MEANNEVNLLSTLRENVEAARKANKKKHEVWKLSFDWKVCNSRAFIKQKLNYMPARLVVQAGHDNPCSGKWDLCNSPIDYLHRFAKYYLSGEDGLYIVTGIEDD